MTIGPYDHLGMSDSALRDEHKAQDMLYPAIAAFRSACQDAMALSDTMRDQIEQMLDAMNGEEPCRKLWDERIAAARQPDNVTYKRTAA